jgi:hypothetical protein
MRVFIGGIMQGSHQANVMADQGYREAIGEALRQRWAGVEVVDPLLLHPEGLAYGDDGARQTLLEMLALTPECDLVVAYLPTASMGTALEMYSAYRAGVPIVAVSPMQHNWVLRAFARRIYPDLPSFLAAIERAETLTDLMGDDATSGDPVDSAPSHG